MADLVGEIVAENRLLADSSGVDLQTRGGVGPVVYAESAALARAVGNLVSNAFTSHLRAPRS